MNHILVRTNASPKIGAGHLMRCLALAEVWKQQGGQASFLVGGSVPELLERLRERGFGILHADENGDWGADAESTIRVAREQNAGWVVLDGYGFDEKYQRQIKQEGVRLLVWDDYGHANEYHADLILNQNSSAVAHLYARRQAYTELLLGPEFAVLRQEFRERRDRVRQNHEQVAYRVLITLGAADPEGETVRLLRALTALSSQNLEILVIIGSANSHIASIDALASENQQKFRIRRDVRNMADTMAWADVAISAGGSTCWELAFMGVPTIVVVQAPNQALVAHELDAAGAVINLGSHVEISDERIRDALDDLLQDRGKRVRMSACAQRLVDGRGAGRVIKRMRQNSLTLRRVNEDDARFLWHLANDPLIRAVSLSSAFIPWPSHVQWFQDRLGDPNSVIFIGIDAEGDRIGYVRFEINRTTATVSVGVREQARGRGYGTRLIKKGITSLLHLRPDIAAVDAFLKPQNDVSRRLFARCGFEEQAVCEVKGQEVRHVKKWRIAPHAEVRTSSRDVR